LKINNVSTLWAVGGEQRPMFRQREEWRRFRAALVVAIGEDGQPRRVLEYVSPPAHCPAEPSVVFKAATLDGKTAYLCTQTEVLICDLPGFAVRRVLSLPCFNDLHHVTPGPDGTLFVAVTGLDAVAEITPEGELLRLVDVLGGDPWARFDRDVDWRQVPTTKPHRAHPNYVFFLDGRPWVTRFEQRDAVPLDRPCGGERLAIEIEGVHDGHVDGERVHFTTVDGHLITMRRGRRDPRGCQDDRDGTREVLDLNSLAAEPDRPLGWCRGLLHLGDRAWVGFTRLRYTSLRRNLSWVRHGFRASPDHAGRPTRLALYDLARPALLREIDLEPAGMGAVFSLHAS
jgi:hypothetical protein